MGIGAFNLIMRIVKITENKKQFLDLLLLADEQEDMIERYLPGGDLFALYDGGLKMAYNLLI